MGKEQTVNQRWEKAIKHAREMIKVYGELPIGSSWYGVATIGEKISLYEKGDRSEALLEEMEKIK